MFPTTLQHVSYCPFVNVHHHHQRACALAFLIGKKKTISLFFLLILCQGFFVSFCYFSIAGGQGRCFAHRNECGPVRMDQRSPCSMVNRIKKYGGIRLPTNGAPVFFSLLNIWGVMLFLRLSWVIGQAGIGIPKNRNSFC